MKPYYQRSGITIYCGDCLEVMPLLEPPFDAIISDWPYGTTQNKWDSVIPLQLLWPETLRLVKSNGVILTTTDEPFTSVLITSNLELFRYRWTWRKSRPTGFLDSSFKPLDDTEDIPVFYRQKPMFNPQMFMGAPNHVVDGAITKTKRTLNYNHYGFATGKKTYEKHPRLVLDFQSLDPAQTVHPTQKPEALYQYLIRTYTNPGELVLDNTMGSGTTLVAAQNEGRQAVGIELSEEYCKIAVERLRQPSFFTLLSNKALQPNGYRPEQQSLFAGDDTGNSGQ